MPTQYKVKQGDCISSIAAECGILWQTIWNHPDNADLKQKRQDPNVLFPGDIVTVPDLDVKQHSCPTDKKHKFEKKQSPTHLKIRLLLDDQPRASVAYELQLAGATINGSTDGGGYLQHEIPPDVESGVLIVTEGTIRDVFQLGFGTLDPIDTDEGVRGRLASLGFNADDDLQAAVRAFQSHNKMDPTGVLDDTLRKKLQEKFGQ